MEDVLDVYTQPYDKDQPLLCMDETSKQQIMELRLPIGCEPGQSPRYDSHYKRNGVSNLFMFFAPLDGWRHVKVTDRRTKIDWAWAMRELVDRSAVLAARPVRVSGSGSTLFTAFDTQSEAWRFAELASEELQLSTRVVQLSHS